MRAELGTDGLEEFERHRSRLFGIAYRMLGSVQDAEDVLQSAFVRWHEAGAAARSAEAWLVAVVTRLSIDRLRSASGERLRYVGDWLPEPIATEAPPGADARAEMASDLSMAFLRMLERLSPDERAAFLLHEVFEAGYAEIARVLGRSEAACRQIVHRARQRVRQDRPRFPVPLDAKERLVGRFLAGLEAGDEQALLAVIAEDAPWISDGGGKVPAARRLRGAARIVRFLLRVSRKAQKLGLRTRRERVWVNGEPAVATYLQDHLFSTLSFETDGERVLAFYTVLNPEKLRHVGEARPGPAHPPITA